MKNKASFSSVHGKVAFILVGTIATLLTAPSGQAATITFDGGPSGAGTALDTDLNWVGDVLPTTSSEVLFDNSAITLPVQLTTTGASPTYGDLIWNSNVSSAITINTTTTTSRTITLSGAAGSTEAAAQGGASGDLIVMGNAAINNTIAIGGNAGTGSARLGIALGASGNFDVVNSGATLSITGIVSGNFNLNKTGAGTLTLSGVNTFGSATTSMALTSGTLNINSTTALGAAANTFVINGGTIDNTSGAALTTAAYKQTWNGDFAFTGTNNLSFSTGAVSLGTAAGTARTVAVNAGNLTIGGVISESSGATAKAMVKTGAGTLTLSGTNTFTGGVTIKSGTVVVGAAGSLGTGTLTLGDTSGANDASYMASSTGGMTTANPIIVASGNTGTATIGAAAAHAGYLILSGTISLGHDLTVTNASKQILTLAGVISETGGPRALTVNAGPGTVAISAANTFTGGFTLNSGRLQLAAANTTGTGVFTMASNWIDATAAATLSNSAYRWNSDFTFVGSSALTLGTGPVTLGGNRVVTTNILNGSTIALTVGNGIGDGGNGYGLTKSGPGILNLNGANTYSGPTIVSRGTLNLTLATSSLANTSGVTVTGGILNLGVASGAGAANRISASAGLTLGGSGTFSMVAGATGPVNSQSFTSLGIVAGSGQLGTNSVTNAGTLSFSGSGSSVYTRATGGTVRFVGTAPVFANAPTGSSTIGSGSSAILIGAVAGTAAATNTTVTDFVKAGAGAIAAPTYGLNAWASGVNTDVTVPQTVSGNTQSLRFNASAGFAVNLAGTSTIESGGILVTGTSGGGTLNGGSIQAASGKDLWVYTAGALGRQDLTINSAIVDNGNSSLTKTGQHTLFLTNPSNTYAGGTYLGEGILNVTSGGTLGTGPLTFTGNATLQAGASTVDLGTRGITLATDQVATFDSNGNTMLIGGVISGAGGLTKTGPGTVTLTGANTYSGPTVITGGTLKLDFSAPGAPVSDIIGNNSLISPGFGATTVYGATSQTLLIQGKDGTANSQTFGGIYVDNNGNPEPSGLYFSKGMTHLNLVAGANGGTLTANLGIFGRGYSTDVNDNIDISIGSGVTVTTTRPASTLPLMGAYTVNGNTWAVVTNGQVLPYTAFSSSYSTTDAVLDVGAGGTLTANPKSLRFNATAPATVALGTGVVRTMNDGGILVTSAVGANPTTITGSALSGYAARDLIIHQNNTAGDLQIDASIVDVIARIEVLSKNGPGRLILTAQNTYTGQSFVNEGTVVASGEAVASFTRAATSTVSGTTLSMADTSGAFIGQAVTGPGLTSSGITWTVVAINPGVSVTLSSPANVASSGGTFTFGAGGAMGAGASSVFVAQGATLQIGNGTTGSLLSTQPVTTNGAFIVNRNSDFAFANVVSGTGSFEKQGTGNLTVTGANTYTGDTKISGGILTLGGTAVLVNSTLDYNGYGGSFSFGTQISASIGGLKGSQNLSLNNTSGAAVTLTVGNNGQDTTYSGSLSGLGTVAKSGGGALTLSGSNTYTGTTSVNGGTLNLTGSFSEPGQLTLNVSGGALNLSGSYVRSVYSNNLGLTVASGVFTVSNTGVLGSATAPLGQTAFYGNSVTNFAGNEFLSGTSSTFRIGEGSNATVNVTAGTLTVGTVSASAGFVLGRSSPTASGFLNVSGGTVSVGAPATVIRIGAGFADTETTGAGPSALTISGTGTFTTGANPSGQFLLGTNLAGNTTGTGTINLDGGTLATNRTITGGSVGESVFNFNGGTFQATGTAAALSTTLTRANVRNGGAVIDTNGFAVTLAKPLTHSVIAGDSAIDGGLIKKGAGTLTLSGSSTYTGPTSIQEGTLTISGSLGATRSVDLVGGSLMLSGGSERINDSAAVNLGGTLSFANTLNSTTETMGFLTLSNTSYLDFGTGNSDTFVFSNLSLGDNYLYIYNWTGSFYGFGDSDHGGNQDRLLFGTNVSAEALSHILFYSDNGATPIGFGGQIGFNSSFEIVPIPEPSSFALLGSIGLLGLFGFGGRLRGRRSNRQ